MDAMEISFMPKKKKAVSEITPDIIRDINRIYRETLNKTETARRLNITTYLVSKYLTDENKSLKQSKAKITDEVKQQINEIYQQTRNKTEVSRQLGISFSTVENYLTDESRALVESEWDDRDALWYYIYRLFGQVSETNPVSTWNITQMNKFKAQGMSYRGQLLTLKYFYEVKKGSIERSKGSIGIIPYIWDESKAYYLKLGEKQQEVADAIKAQLEKDRVEIKYTPSSYMKKRKKKKQEIDISKIKEEEDK